jgi:hypothetical protein
MRIAFDTTGLEVDQSGVARSIAKLRRRMVRALQRELRSHPFPCRGDYRDATIAAL